MVAIFKQGDKVNIVQGQLTATIKVASYDSRKRLLITKINNRNVKSGNIFITKEGFVLEGTLKKGLARDIVEVKEKSFRDRRKTPRMPLQTVVEVWKDYKESVHTMSKDISEGGIGIFTPQKFEVGEVLNLKFQDTEIRGVVRWNKLQGTGYVMGIEFMQGYNYRAAKNYGRT